MLMFNRKCVICGQVKRMGGSQHCAVCALNFRNPETVKDPNTGLPIGWQKKGDVNFEEIVKDTRAFNVGQALLGLGVLIVFAVLWYVNNLLGLG